MSLIKRRQFLQFAGSALATIGWSQLDFIRQSDRYGKVLAQSTPRKIALLVGINEYPDTSEFSALKGCITDVDLQRHLLIHRFGFNPNDVHTLTDKQATRQGILGAFEEYLIKQAKPGDVVVFHFSGHGSRVDDPDCDYKNEKGRCLNSTLVPFDSQLPAGFPDKGGVVEDIMGHTLFLLMSAVPTENLTVVLDSCYSGGGTRGNFRIRSRDGGSQLQISPVEKTYQEQWLSRLNMPPQTFITERRAGVAKGVVIAASQRHQTAADATIHDFYAGAFTYLMTQYLWQQTGAIESAIANITRDLKPFSRQVPLSEAKPQSGNERKPIYFIDKQIPPAEAVITEVTGNQAKLWLGGLDRESLRTFNKGATFTIIDANGRSSGQVTLSSRKGLVGEAILEAAAQPGALLQETARVIPSDLKLRIGLDSLLGADANSAKQALQEIKRIEPVSFRPGNVPYEGEVQYILSRMTAADRQGLSWSQSAFSEGGQEEIPAEGSIGLFSPGRDEGIPDSFGEAGETVAQAVTRLEAKLKSLLAVRIVKMTLNASSSRLNLSAAMMQEGGNEVIAQAFTARGTHEGRSAVQERNGRLSKQLPLGTPFQFRVTNDESRPVYLSILVIDPKGGIIVLFPNQWLTSDNAIRLDAGKDLLIPNPAQDDFQAVTQEKGIGEALIIASTSPLKKALLTLQTLAEQLKQARGPLVPNEPVEVMGDFLEDLSSDRGSHNVTAASREMRTAEIAALSITFEVV
jgi:hypothetical protein